MNDKCICGKNYELESYKKKSKCKECWAKYQVDLRNRKKSEGTYVIPIKKPHWKKGGHTPEALKIYWKIYYEKNKKKLNEKRKIYMKKPENKMKQYARWISRDAVKNGKLIKKPCEFCGNIESQIHHKDYHNPLDIQWLCRICHLKLHHPKDKTK